MKNLVILGATGSIGRSALAVAEEQRERVRVVGLAARNNAAALEDAARRFPGARTVLAAGADGEKRLAELAALPEADMVLVAIVGAAALRPALAAIAAGKDLALASKEILVAAGELVMREARKHGVEILPVDSEHNAIHQCLAGRRREDVRRLILTCSGGPFRQSPVEQIAQATPEEALRHPTWAMGQKISVDSATLFNKGLEMIEARWLFDMPIEQIEVIVHPQSLVHSMVELVDGSVLAQLSPSDMRLPIQYALTWPERLPNTLPRLDLARVGRLDFEPPREDVFPALRLAREACQRCGTAPAILNAANEAAVAAFLNRRIAFPHIWELVERAMTEAPHGPADSLDKILAADAWARQFVAAQCR